MMQDAEFILGLPDLLVRDFWYSFEKLHRSEYLTLSIIILIEILNSSLPRVFLRQASKTSDLTDILDQHSGDTKCTLYVDGNGLA